MSLVFRVLKNKQRWNRFVTSSAQGNVFCTTSFLNALGEDYDLLFVEKNRRSQVGAVVLKRNGQPIRAPYPFTMYQGILFAASSRSMPHHRRVKWALEVTEFLLAGMEQRYNRISFCLHYGAEDLRGFQWFHYHKLERGQFKLNLRYTGLINLKAFSNFESYLKTIRKVRRYEYRQAIKNKLVIEQSNDIGTLDRLHQLTFKRQGIKRTAKESKILKNITRAALSLGFGELLLCKNSKGKAISATLYLYDKKCGYYLFGANHPDYRRTGSGTFLMLENIRRCQEKGLCWIDVCGINSPNRGDFKTSFNAKPTPYFVVTWEKPHQ